MIIVKRYIIFLKHQFCFPENVVCRMGENHGILYMGYLLLEGGAEFTGRMDEADKRALTLAGGKAAPVDVIPAAAAPDNNQHRACQNGVEWFRRLGAQNVQCSLVIDRESADKESLSKQLRDSKFVFLLGGFPLYLAQALTGSRSWRSICAVYHEGGVIGGSSAGAMVFGEKLYDPLSRKVYAGLNLMPGVCLVPHHNSSRSGWISRLLELLPDFCLLGIDEETGVINDAPRGGWTVYGRGTAVVYHQGKVHSYTTGDSISYTELPPPKIDL